MEDIHVILKRYWGFDRFRPSQEDIISSIIDGHDTLALMPTGGGKSLCYQVPAMAGEGMCLVISPLIALMKDQVENLRKKGITAYAIYSGMTRKELMNVLKVVTESNCKFLYVSPERLETALFKEFLPGMGISLIAVDEAHCISQWGYDFRPSYLRIVALREELPHVPVLALTASATPDVQRDICDRLLFNNETIVRQSFERPNISYSVFPVESKISKIIDILQKIPGCGIVYCKSRKRTREISELLKLQHISADYYHAGLPQEERSAKQEAWIQNKTRIVVCTNAFGMGIDKPDVRVVIHADVPDSLENYYQEAGRAGRDGKTAYAVLLYDDHDLRDLAAATDQRFPSLQQIHEVYQSVVNYLQLPTGDGKGQYFEFDLPDFLRKFKLDSHATLYSLKALEQDGWLAFNEQVFIPSTIHFTMLKRPLEEFEQRHPDLDPLIKTLLRSYEGIFDQPVFITEKSIAYQLRKDEATIKVDLLRLDRAGVIEYIPQKDKPQVIFLRARTRTEEVTIDLVAYNKRKERYELRVKQMLSYIHDLSVCRGVIIGQYFGDEKINTCGICDNCLRQKSRPLTTEEFNAIQEQILHIVKNEPLPAKELLLKLRGIHKEKAWKVLEFLQAENSIEMDATGMVRMR